MMKEAEPQELHQLLQLVVRRIELMPDGSHQLDLHYAVPKPKSRHDSQESRPDYWLEGNVWNGCLGHHSIKPLILKVTFRFNMLLPEASFFPLILNAWCELIYQRSKSANANAGLFLFQLHMMQKLCSATLAISRTAKPVKSCGRS